MKFGKYGEGHLRSSYANSIENIDRALARIDKALKDLKKIIRKHKKNYFKLKIGWGQSPPPPTPPQDKLPLPFYLPLAP